MYIRTASVASQFTNRAYFFNEYIRRACTVIKLLHGFTHRRVTAAALIRLGDQLCSLNDQFTPARDGPQLPAHRKCVGL